jgi:hypothetical protein
MLWDDKYLYVGAIIGDPNDVMRKNAAKIGNLDADITGLDRQSCVQLEICNRNLRENDDVTKLDPQGMKTYELTFWYSADENKACLVVKGKDSDASLVSKVLLHKGPEGFEAVIRRAGADCVLEAKIPWALIGGLPYKSMKTSWKVTWVDTRGNPSISGALIDVVAKKGDDFDAKDWQSNIAKWGTAELSPNPQP